MRERKRLRKVGGVPEPGKTINLYKGRKPPVLKIVGTILTFPKSVATNLTFLF